MTQKDYIKRGNPKAGKRKKAPAAETVPATLPIIPLVFAGLVLAGFGYFLWAINGAADIPQQDGPGTTAPAAQAQIQAKAKNKAKAIKAQPDIPPPPEEDWQYIEALKRKTVDVAVTKAEKKGPFLMQCATFKDARRAEAFKAQLALLNFESWVKVSNGSKGTFHRVQLGPYKTNRDALRARHKLNKHKINGCKIWLWS